MSKVLHIGFDFHPGETGRGGVILYQWSLMKDLARVGWEVVFLDSSRHTFTGRLRIRAGRRDGIRVVEILDSPLRPYEYNRDPIDTLEDPAMEDAVARVLRQEKPDLVHLHDTRLFPSSIIECIRKRRLPAVKTIHNYHDLCPQSEFMFKGKEPCLGDRKGARCSECLSSLPRASLFNQRLSGHLRGTFLLPVLRGFWQGYKRRLRPGGDPPPFSFPPQFFEERRRRNIQLLNSLDGILCSSGRVREILSGHGVEEGRLLKMPISSSTIDSIRPAGQRSAAKPVTFGYLTGDNHLKGYLTLLAAFPRLDQSRARLILFGFPHRSDFQRRFGKWNIQFRGPYHPGSINSVLSEIDVGLVPSIWEEVFGLAGIEFLSARIPVIGSRIGGIQEWLRDGENGFLCTPGDADDLAGKMGRFVEEPGLLRRMRDRIRPWKTMGDHAAEIASYYRSLLPSSLFPSSNTRSREVPSKRSVPGGEVR